MVRGGRRARRTSDGRPRRTWWAALAILSLALLRVAAIRISSGRSRGPLTADAPDIATALTSYLATAARMHYGLWSDAFFSTARQALFPGVVALVLGGAALAAPHPSR